jgi:Ca-activated chloride channel family protein
MKFGDLHMAHLLWLLPALILFFIRAHNKRKRDMKNFADTELLHQLAHSVNKKGRTLRIACILVAVFLIILSLIRPQWGFEWQEVKRSGLDILIAIDTSKSMLAEDVKPNRLERSKFAVKDLIKKLRGDRIGLIAFSGSAFLQCPLTVDYNGFHLSLDNLSPGTIPKGGTSITSAIRVALDSYEGGMKKYKVLVIITDGEDHEGTPLDLAEEAREKGIKIFTIGIGTKGGELIPVTDASGSRIYLKDRNGNVVKTRLDEETLRKIALNTGGSYVKATGSEFGLELIYDEKLSKMEQREIENKMIKKYEERFQIPLMLALIIIGVELFIRERREGM